MEKLFRLAKSVNQASTIPEVMVATLENIENVVNCQIGAFFLFENDLLRAKDKKALQVQKTLVERKYIDIVGLTDMDAQNPSFNSIEDAHNQIFTQKYMS